MKWISAPIAAIVVGILLAILAVELDVLVSARKAGRATQGWQYTLEPAAFDPFTDGHR